MEKTHVPYPTLNEIKSATDDYWQVWQQLLAKTPALRKTIGQHLPDALGWKVEGDVAPLEAAERLYELGDSIHMGPVNRERAILTIRKPRPLALDALQHIKLLQRRPSRPDDKLGADSLDFVVPHGLPSLEDVEKALTGVTATCKIEHNPKKNWLTISYEGHEFKLVDHTIWAVCARDCEELL